MPSYSVNERAVARARRLIETRQYASESDWETRSLPLTMRMRSWSRIPGMSTPNGIGLTDEASDQTKARYAFVYGDFRRIHRSGLIACQYRAAEWHHKEIELTAHELLQQLDDKSA